MKTTGVGGRLIFLCVVVGLVVAADQLTKILVLRELPLYDSVAVIPGMLRFTHVQNSGGAFGFLAGSGSGVRQWLFVGVSLMAMALVIYFYFNTPRERRLLAWAFALILGGACGNLTDRLRFGLVVDFIDVYVHDLHWPAFNLADSAITCGIAIFVYHMLAGKLPGDETRGKP